MKINEYGTLRVTLPEAVAIGVFDSSIRLDGVKTKEIAVSTELLQDMISRRAYQGAEISEQEVEQWQEADYELENLDWAQAKERVKFVKQEPFSYDDLDWSEVE